MAETYTSGQGGHVRITAAIQRPVSEWRMKKHALLADATTSTGQRRKKVLGTADWSFTTPWDLDQTPESIGITEGAEISDIRFLLGASGLMYQVGTGIIESFEIINDATKDITRLSVTGYSQGPVGAPVVAA